MSALGESRAGKEEREGGLTHTLMHTPTSNIQRRTRTLNIFLSHLEPPVPTRLAMMAPVCTMGPSRPAGMPATTQQLMPRTLAMSVRGRRAPSSLLPLR